MADTVMCAVLAMDAYWHNPDNGSWYGDIAKFFSKLETDQLGNYTLTAVSTSEAWNGYGVGAGSPPLVRTRRTPLNSIRGLLI